jgi:hypothetical protein
MSQFGIRVARGGVASTPEEAEKIARELGTLPPCPNPRVCAFPDIWRATIEPKLLSGFVAPGKARLSSFLFSLRSTSERAKRIFFLFEAVTAYPASSF